MITVRYDSKQINKILNNAVSYSYGFLEGTDIGQIEFNKMLADYTIDALNQFIDAHARMDPESLHHVYEWDEVGVPSGRLFEFSPKVSKRVIHINGRFLQSKSVSEGGTVPFYNKAEIMEEGIAITIEPNSSDVLVFEDENELVFTANSVYVEHPGGDEVAGSFGRLVDEFFGNYFTNALMLPFMKRLSTPSEFSRQFPQGTKSGKSTGVKAGKKYIASVGDTIE